MSLHNPPRRIRKEINQLAKARNNEIREAEKAQRKGNLREAIVHKDRAVDKQIQIDKLIKQNEQRFVPITKIRSSNF